MATFNLTNGGDWFVGGSGDDTFISTPGLGGYYSNMYQTLDSFDILDGGAGNDVLNMTMGPSYNYGYSPVIENIEEINLRVTNYSSGYLDLSYVTGVDVINVQDSISGNIHIYNVGEFNNFGFHDNTGNHNVYLNSIDAPVMNLEFTNTGDMYNPFDLDINGEDYIKTVNIDMLNSNVDIDSNYSSSNAINTVNINSEGINDLELYGMNDGYITDLSITGMQGGEIEIDANFDRIENVNAGTFTGDIDDLNLGGNEVVQVTTGSGSDDIDFYEGLADGATVTTGQGGDDIDGQDVYDGVSISTGKGHDDVDFDDVYDYVSITTGKGDDDVSLDEVGEHVTIDTGDGSDYISTGDIDKYSTINAGTTDNANDYLYLGDVDKYADIDTGGGSDVLYTGDIGSYSSIDTGSAVIGDGDDYIYIDSSVGAYSSVMTGDGDDEVQVGYKYEGPESASIGYGSVVDTGNGNDYIGVQAGMYSDIESGVSISTGDGEDIIRLSTKYTESDSYTEYNDGSWYYGNTYSNEITYNNYYGGVTIGSDVSITTGAGEDFVVATAFGVGADVIVGEDSTISTGKDDDVIALVGEDSVVIGDNVSINTGNGDDQIMLAGDGYYGDTVTRSGEFSYDGSYGYYGPYSYGPYTNSNGQSGTVIGSDVTISTGDGDDTLQIGNNESYGDTYIGDGVSISTGDGSDTVSIQDGYFYGPYSYYGSDSLVGNDVSINTGADNDYVQIFGDVGDYASIDTGTGDDALDVYGNVEHYATVDMGDGNDTLYIGDQIEDYATVSMGDGNDILRVEDDIQDDAVVSMGSGKDTLIVNDDVRDDASISMDGGHDTLMIDDTVHSSAMIDGGLGDDTIGLSADTVDELSDDGSYITNFESLIVDFSEYEGEEYTFDMAELDNINDVTFENGSFGDIELTGITSGANVNLTDGGGELNIDMEDQVSDVLNLSTTNDNSSDASFEITADLIETINIEADADGETDITHTIDLSANAVETVNVTGDAHVVLDSSLGTVTTLTAGNGGVEADLSGETNTRTVTTGDGADTIITDSGSDTITTGKGGDTIESGGGADTINAGKGHDTIDAGNGADTINAGKGDDTVTGGGKADTIDLGADTNNDTLVYEDQSDSAASTTLRDTVNNFISGDDQIDLTQVTIDGEVDYLGEFATKGLLLSDLTGGEDNSEAGLVSNASIQKLLIDVNGDGGIDADEDMDIVLNGVTDMDQTDFAEAV